MGTDLAKPMAYRLLKTLKEMYMAPGPVTRRYYLGATVAKLASNPRTNHHDLITCALDEMEQLWNITIPV
jgi:DNA-binding IclR family transcriptional regulator